MKKLMVVVLLLIMALSQPARAGKWNVWTYGDNEVVGARIGWDLKEDIEIGFGSIWWPNDKAPQIYNVYGIYQWPDIVEIPNPISLDFLPDTLEGKPYIGAQVGVSIDNDGSFAGPVAGLVLQDIWFVEYQYRSIGNKLEESFNDEHKLVVGIKFEF